jgi:hypothetical protein
MILKISSSFINFSIFLVPCLIVSLVHSSTPAENEAVCALKASFNITTWGTCPVQSNDSPCSWSGILCRSSDNAIQVINLQGLNRNGSLPTQIGLLENLESLALSGNYINGTLPTQLGSLKFLTVIDIQKNLLTGGIPTSLAQIAILQEILLSFNKLSAPLPSQLGALSNLIELNLNENQIEGTIPTEFGRLTNLIDFDLSNNKISGTLPTQIGKLSSLTNLILSTNQLLGTIPSQWNSIKPVYLDLSRNPGLCGCLPTNWLNFSFCNVTGILHGCNCPINNCFSDKCSPEPFSCVEEPSPPRSNLNLLWLLLIPAAIVVGFVVYKYVQHKKLPKESVTLLR